MTVPVMDEAATATRGQTDTATSTTASHSLFLVPRMLGSLVIVHLLRRRRRRLPPLSKRSVGAGFFCFARILHRTPHPSTASSTGDLNPLSSHRQGRRGACDARAHPDAADARTPISDVLERQ